MDRMQSTINASVAVTEGKLVILLGTTASRVYPFLAGRRARLDDGSGRRTQLLAVDTMDLTHWLGIPAGEAVQIRVPRGISWVLDGRGAEYPISAALMPPYRPLSTEDGTTGVRNDGYVAAANLHERLRSKLQMAVTRALGLPESGFETYGMTLRLSVYVIAFIGGGTAPGELPILLLVLAELLREMLVDRHVELHLILPSLLPGDSPDTIDRRRSNAYSVLLELAAFRAAASKNLPLVVPLGDAQHSWTGDLADQVYLYSDTSIRGTVRDPLILPSLVAREVQIRITDGWGVGREIREDRVRLHVLQDLDDRGRPTMFSVAAHAYLDGGTAELAEGLAARATIDVLRSLWSDVGHADEDAGLTLWERFTETPSEEEWVENQLAALRDVPMEPLRADELLVNGLAAQARKVERLEQELRQAVRRRAEELKQGQRSRLERDLVSYVFSPALSRIGDELRDLEDKLTRAEGEAAPVPSDTAARVQEATKQLQRVREDERREAAEGLALAHEEHLRGAIDEEASRQLRTIIMQLRGVVGEKRSQLEGLRSAVERLAAPGGPLEQQLEQMPVWQSRSSRQSPLERPLFSRPELERLYQALTSPWPFPDTSTEGVTLAPDVAGRLAAWVRDHDSGAINDAERFAAAVRGYWRDHFESELRARPLPQLMELVHDDERGLQDKLTWMSRAARGLMTWLDLATVEARLTTKTILQAPDEYEAVAQRVMDDGHRLVSQGAREALVLSRCAHGLELDDFPELAPGGEFRRAYRERQSAWLDGRGQPVHGCLALESLVRDLIFEGDWGKL